MIKKLPSVLPCLTKKSKLDKRTNLKNTDAIIFISQTPENKAPGSSHQIHKKFNIKKRMCLY